jgi:hypothetical protein
VRRKAAVFEEHTLLQTAQDSIRVLKKYMELVPDSAQFSLVALCSAA